MTLLLSENLRKLRTERQLTQEQLSEFLGVAPQTVSRWEIGKVSPDISLLPIIAGYFNISVDELLGVDTAHKDEKIKAILKENLTLHNNGETEKSIELLRRSLEDYPNDARLLYSLAQSLHKLYFRSRVKFSDEERKNAALEAVELLKKALRYTDENFDEGGGIRQQLVENYIALGEYEKAKETALKAPYMFMGREFLLASALRGKEAAVQYQNNLLSLTNTAIYNSIWGLRAFGEYSDEQILEISLMAEKVLLLIGGEHSGFTSLFSNALVILNTYIKICDREKILEYLDKAIQYAGDYEERPDLTKYNVLWLRDCENNSKNVMKHSQDNLYLRLFDVASKQELSELFADDERFKAILDKIKSHIG